MNVFWLIVEPQFPESLKSLLATHTGVKTSHAQPFDEALQMTACYDIMVATSTVPIFVAYKEIINPQ